MARLRAWAVTRLDAHDPGRVGLGRGLRAAIALPVALVLMLYVFDMPIGASFAAFGVIGLLTTADFSGTAWERARAYLLTGVAGTVLLLVGWVSAGHLVAATVVTLIVTFALASIGAIRGTLAVGAPPALLVYLLAACVGGPDKPLSEAVTGWWVAVLVSTACALAILPRQRSTQVREALADVIRQYAQAASAAWQGEADFSRAWQLVDSADTKVDDLTDLYAGKPFRPSAVLGADRALSMLIDQVFSLRALLHTLPRLTTPLPDRSQAELDYGNQIATTLDHVASGIVDGHTNPSVAPLVSSRAEFREAAARATARRSRNGDRLANIASDLQQRHVLGMAGLIAEQMGQLTHDLHGVEREEFEGSLHIPRLSTRVLLRVQLDPRSPWFRSSVRKAIGLAAAMAIVTATNLAFGFWVLLGVVAILRFDSMSTNRSAWQAVLGTATGVVAATGLLTLIGNNELVLWLLVPVAVFVAAWAGVALKFPIAQGVLSGFVVLMVNLTAWPPDISRGELRILDMALGAVVAAVVGLVLWPHGATGVLRQQVASTTLASWGYLRDVLESFRGETTSGNQADAFADAHHAALIAAETYDVSLMQRGNGLQGDAMWAALTGDARLMLRAGRIMEPFAGLGPVAVDVPALSAAFGACITRGDRFWGSIAEQVEAGTGIPSARIDSASDWSHLEDRELSDEEAYAFVLTIWTIDWCDRIEMIASESFDRLTMAR